MVFPGGNTMSLTLRKLKSMTLETQSFVKNFLHKKHGSKQPSPLPVNIP